MVQVLGDRHQHAGARLVPPGVLFAETRRKIGMEWACLDSVEPSVLCTQQRNNRLLNFKKLGSAVEATINSRPNCHDRNGDSCPIFLKFSNRLKTGMTTLTFGEGICAPFIPLATTRT